MNVVTKWRRVCSPSLTMSMPALLLVAQHEPHRVVLALGSASILRASRRPTAPRARPAIRVWEGFRQSSCAAACSSRHRPGGRIGSRPGDRYARRKRRIGRVAAVARAARRSTAAALDRSRAARTSGTHRGRERIPSPSCPRSCSPITIFPTSTSSASSSSSAGLELVARAVQDRGEVIDAARDCSGILLQYAPITRARGRVRCRSSAS